MVWDSAHRGTFIQTTAFPGQCDLKLSGCSQGIVKEHFVEIAEAVE